MSTPDLNLLITLDALLAEGSVARAAERLRLSPSAMSRALARLRQITGDPLLVRAGRRLVPTPRALELREPVDRLVEEARRILRPQEGLDRRRLDRTFSLRAGEGFVETFGPDLVALVSAEAPAARLRFMLKPDKDQAPLRDGTVDPETGLVGGATGPEVRAQGLFRDRFIGVVRQGHALARGGISRADYACGRHVAMHRHGLDQGLVELVLEQLGLGRTIVAMVSGCSAALARARRTEGVRSRSGAGALDRAAPGRGNLPAA